jgi:putative membrane protein
MRTQILSGVAVFALLSFPALAQNSQRGSANRLTGPDQTFLRKAAQANMFEIEMGKIAERSTNPTVKQFAQRMVTDHTKLQDQLKTVATQEGVTLPAKVSSSEQSSIAKLSKQTGATFDRDYINTMVTDHKTDITEFQNEANNGTDPSLKNAAQGALPTLHEHLTLAENAQKTVG